MILTQKAYRVMSGYGSLGKKQPFIVWEHNLTSHVAENLIVVAEDWENNSSAMFNTLHLVPRDILREIKTINHIPFEDVKVGDKVVSAINNQGFITKVNYDLDGRYYGRIDILWETGNETRGAYELSDVPWLTSIEYVGQ